MKRLFHSKLSRVPSDIIRTNTPANCCRHRQFEHWSINNDMPKPPAGGAASNKRGVDSSDDDYFEPDEEELEEERRLMADRTPNSHSLYK